MSARSRSLVVRMRRLLVGSALIIVVAAVLVGLLLARNLEDIADRDELLAAPAEAAAAQEAFHDQAEAARSGFQGDPNAIGPYTEAGERLDRNLGLAVERLEGTGSGAEQLQGSVAAWRDSLFAAASDTTNLPQGAQLDVLVLPATLVEGFDELVTTATATLDDAEDDVTTSRRLLVAGLIGGIGLAVGLFSLVAWAIWAWAVRPTRRLSEQVAAVEGGDMHALIHIETPEELASLARSVDGMRDLLLTRIDEVTAAERGLLQREPLVAAFRDVLAPVEAVVPSRFAAAGRLQPAEGVLAGDWYDVLPLSDTVVAVSVGDVAGHGPAAGVLAFAAKHAALDGLSLGLEPHQVVSLVADRYGRRSDFVTLFVAIVDAAEGTVRYANAGHPRARIVGRSDVTLLGPTGPLIGPLATTWETLTAPIGHGEMLVVYTDGITEARSPDGDQFGEDRIDEICRASGGDVERCADRLLSAVRDYRRGRPGDDATVVALTVRSVVAAADRAG